MSVKSYWESTVPTKYFIGFFFFDSVLGIKPLPSTLARQMLYS